MGRKAHHQPPLNPEPLGPRPASDSADETPPEDWQVTIVTGDAPDAQERLARAVDIILTAAARTQG